MLPFLKNRHEGSTSGPVDMVIERKSDDGEDDYGMLDAISEDLLHAVHSKNKKLLRDCLEALIEHIQEEDAIQDEEHEE